MRRRFRVSNFQSTTKVRPFCTTMPIGLSSGWNQVQFNLSDFTKRAYGNILYDFERKKKMSSVSYNEQEPSSIKIMNFLYVISDMKINIKSRKLTTIQQHFWN